MQIAQKRDGMSVYCQIRWTLQPEVLINKEFIMIKGSVHWKDKTVLISVHSVTCCKNTQSKNEQN